MADGDRSGGNRGNVENLRAAVAKRANWGTPGDFTRCHAFLVSKGVGDEKANRICASWHHDATGMWPGDRDNK
jgi:hypothetical protein